MTKKLIILGSAIRGGALLILDSLKRASSKMYEPVGILDDTPGIEGTEVLSVPILGGLDKAENLYKKNFFDEAIIAVGNVEGRRKIFQNILNTNIRLANIIDESVLFRSSVSIGIGNIILSGCDFGPFVSIGDNNFFCSHTIVEHESRIGDGSLFGIGCTFAGRVRVGNSVSCGARSGAQADVTIENHSVIPPGIIIQQ